MARRRYLSTEISVDARVNQLAMQYGDFAALLYTWMIPHAEDDRRLRGDPAEIRARVMPWRTDKTAEDVVRALEGMAALGLIGWYDEDGHMVVEFPPSFYEYQTYIPQSKRRLPRSTEKQRQSPQNTDDHRGTAQNTAKGGEIAASPSPSPSPSPSLTFTAIGSTTPLPIERERRSAAAADSQASGTEHPERDTCNGTDQSKNVRRILDAFEGATGQAAMPRDLETARKMLDMIAESGHSVDQLCTLIREEAESFKPTPRNRYIRTLAFFLPAVRALAAGEYDGGEDDEGYVDDLADEEQVGVARGPP